MKSKSFTLIELLVVIVIIGILAGVIIVSVSSSISKANFAKAQSFSNTVQNELLGDLVSEWTFNSPAVSGKTEDSWGNNDGTLYGANGLPQLQTKENCVYGTCYLFDGVDDYIDSGLKDIDSNITLSAWFYLLDEAFQDMASGIVGIRDGTTNQRMYLGIRADSTIPAFLVGDQSISGVAANLNSWYFGLADFNNSTGEMNLYINGTLVGTSFGSRVDSNKNYAIGAVMGTTIPTLGSFFDGYIDNTRIYKGILSTSQIKQEYVAGLDSLLSKNLISQEEYNDKLETLAQN